MGQESTCGSFLPDPSTSRPFLCTSCGRHSNGRGCLQNRELASEHAICRACSWARCSWSSDSLTHSDLHERLSEGKVPALFSPSRKLGVRNDMWDEVAVLRCPMSHPESCVQGPPGLTEGLPSVMPSGKTEALPAHDSLGWSRCPELVTYTPSHRTGAATASAWKSRRAGSSTGSFETA